MGRAYIEIGENEKAIEILEEGMNAIDLMPFALLAYQAIAYNETGDQGKAIKLIDEIMDIKSEASGGSRYYWAAIALACLNKKEEAITSLIKSQKLMEADLIFLKIDRLFDPLRSDPRYKELLTQVGFEPD